MEGMLVDDPAAPSLRHFCHSSDVFASSFGGFKVIAFQAQINVEEGDEHYYLAVAFTWVVGIDNNHKPRLPWK